MVVIPVLLCGGAGRRLWPLSTPEKPKSFLKIASGYSLFQQTMLRCKGPEFSRSPIVVGNGLSRDILDRQLNEIGVDAEIIWEPVGRNSCAAIAIACYQALERQDDPVLLVQACDHLINPVWSFVQSVRKAAAITGNHMVTFGVDPRSAEPGYGYIRPGELIAGDGDGECRAVSEFIEKPAYEKAKLLCENGYLWNSGNFLFRARIFLEELQHLQPELAGKVMDAFANSSIKNSDRWLDKSDYLKLPSMSVDEAVFQKTDKAAVMPVNYEWQDVGNWETISNLLYDTDEADAVPDSIIAQTSQHVGSFSDGASATEFRPWGRFDRLARGSGYQVKRIEVEPGQTLSLQSHQFRSEHWVIVSGLAEITIGNEVKMIGPDQSIHVPLGEVHRLANRQDTPLVLIEVQLGSYFGEDDITRLEDVYNRCSADK